MESTSSEKIIEQVAQCSAKFMALKVEIGKVIVGHHHIIDATLIAMLSRGHVLLEGVPGVAKTTLIKTIADALGLSFSRIQFTPDLLPADLIGTLIYNPKNQEFDDDGKVSIELKHNKDIIKKNELEKFDKLNGRTAIASTKKTKQTLQPPAPFDLTTLQTEAYKFFSITPSQTLSIAQKLYLGGLISYPRTSSQKIPEAMNPLNILKQLGKHFRETEKATRKVPVEGKKSDPAHPAIIPTGNYEKLDSQDEKIYELIVKRFIGCFCDNAELENKSVDVVIDDYKFSKKGMEIVKAGFLEVYPMKMVEETVRDFNGEVKIDKVRNEEKMTQPPKRYSPASILSELEKRNLGTKATRANILETLYDRNYIVDKSIKATELGIRLIDSLKKYSPVIIDEALTRQMEKEMDAIRASKKDLEKKEGHVIDEAKEALVKISADFKKKEGIIGKELIAANEAIWEQQKENNKLEVVCPECKKGQLTLKFSPRFKNYFIACTNYPDCKKTFSLPSRSLIKKAGKNCSECNYPMMISIRQGKRPWIFCFNPGCPTRAEGYVRPKKADTDIIMKVDGEEVSENQNEEA